MTATHWQEVDDYIADHLLPVDEALDAVLRNNEAQGLPPIDVSAAQGKMLNLIARMAGARRILEIGTLGGYSTIWLARALPDDGRLVTLELESDHARIASENLERARVSDKVEIRIGPAIETLKAMTNEEPFDLTFIDADKQNNVAYVREAIRLSRSGATIIVDNVIRDGGILDRESDDVRIQGTRDLYEMLAGEARLDATAVQTVGAKGWDGFILAVVR